MRKITYADALNRIAERTNDNTSDLRKSRLQRRTEFTDLYGVPFYAESDSGNKAVFYISVSPDMVYFMRFQFKIFVQGLADDSDFSIKLADVDITDYLIEQEDGDWIDGEGLFPTNKVLDETDFYDVLDVATVLYNEGDEDSSNAILNPGFKQMEISASSPFKVTLYLYMKYSVTGK